MKTVKDEFADIYTEIIIQPLDENESATLISNLLNIKGLPQSLKDQITERAGRQSLLHRGGGALAH